MTPDNGRVCVMKKTLRKTFSALFTLLLLAALIIPSFAEGTLSADKFRDIRLCPGGMPFGVRIKTDGLLVVGVSDVDSDKGNVSPGRISDIRSGDIVIKADSQKITSAKELSEAAINGNGKDIVLEIKRGEEVLNKTISPVYSQNEKAWRIGLWVRDTSAGIGTVSFIEPESGAFAGLGHGICDPETGCVIPMSRGSVYNVSITGIEQSRRGDPGEIKGVLHGENGFLYGNLRQGVYGKLNFEKSETDKTFPIALKEDVVSGKASIMCTLDGDKPKEYAVSISDIRTDAGGFKDMLIEVTDPELLEKTGGIVQGMSGSTIIQNGKIIGAITHVLIDDPTRGYGIFIENMLSEMPEIYS